MKGCGHNMEETKRTTAGNFVKDYWFIIVTIVSLVMTWSKFTATLEAHTERIIKLETNAEQTTTALSLLNNNLTKLQTILEERLPKQK